jgi:hypothetical protein
MNDKKNSFSELSKLKKEYPFSVPENYFGDFPARLQQRLEAEGNVLPQSSNRIVKFLKPALGLAASFALIVMLVYWPVKKFLPNYQAKTNTTIVMNEENTYLSIIEKLDENSFFGLLQESTIDNGEVIDDFNDDELMNYLSANVSEYEIYLQTEN